MSLILGIPSELAAELMSSWLEICDVCRLEIALCSPDNRIDFLPIYESVVIGLTFDHTSKCPVKSQLKWMIDRKIKIHSLEVEHNTTDSYFRYCDGEDMLVTILSHSKSFVEVIMLEYVRDQAETLFAALAQCCNCLFRIEVNMCSITPSFYALLESSRQLSELVVKECKGFQVHLLESISCPSVQALRTAGSGDHAVLTALFKLCPNATFCEIYAENADLSALPLYLEELVIEACGELHSMQFHADLQTLSIIWCATPEADLAQIFIMCPNLTVIVLDWVSILSSQCIRQIADTCGKSLERLHLIKIPQLDNDVLPYVCSKCPVLHTLDISKNDYIEHSVYVAIFKAAPKLRKLRLGSMEVDDAILQTIAASQLEFLGMLDTSGHTEAGIMVLVDGCASLQCIEINDACVNTIVRKLWKYHCPTLTIRSSIGYL